MRGLVLPGVLAVTVVGVAAVASCGGDGSSQVDAACMYFCIDPGGGVDGGPGGPDAAVCGQVVCLPEDCPSGCEPVG